MLPEQFSVSNNDKQHTDSESAILSYDRSQCHTFDVPMQHQDEYKAADNIDYINEYGYPHRQLGVLHADKPSLDGIESQCRRRSPYADIEIT